MNKNYEWDFTDYFKSLEEFLKSLEEVSKQIDNFKKTIVDMSLENKLKEFYNLSLKIEVLITYSELKSDLDISNETYLKYKNDSYVLKSKMDYFKKVINEEILRRDITLEEYIRNNPNLESYYMHLYEVLRLKKHNVNNSVISNENYLINRINNLYNIILNVEMPCEKITIDDKKIEVNKTIYNKYCCNENQNIRKDIFKAFMNSLKNVNKSISELFNIRYQMCFDIAKEKGYQSILEQVISEDDLDEKIIDNLINSVHEHLPLLNRYLKLKKKKLNMQELHYYDLNINSDYNPKYSFDEALVIVKEALKDLGKEYQEVLNKVLMGGMLDVFPKKHKFGGGYHFRNYIKPMILMNYKENFKEVATIGHELGHAVNGVLTRQNQEYQNFHFSVFLSEIASTVNEDRVEEYMYKIANEEDKTTHLEQIIDKTVMAIFFQTLFLEFQKSLCEKIENGESLNSDIINNTFLDLYSRYYNELTIDEELKYLWQTRLHLFYGPYRYYNFQYATGKIAALVINKNINEGKVDNYLKFLTIGGSKRALEALKVAGVDLTCKKAFDDAMLYLNNLLDEYELILKKSR